MIQGLARLAKRLPLYALFGRWRHKPALHPGYTIALPMPMDMPFLLRLALEGIRGLDTTNCKQILVVPDGWGTDQGRSLKAVISEFEDPRIQFVDLRPIDYRVIRAMRPPGCARTHWMLVVNSVLHATHEYIFLHDADAFFLAADGIERQYAEAIQRGMDVLGVTARWDSFFTEHDITVAGTWELMFATAWARKRSPLALFPGGRSTELGDHAFDSMLYSQFLDRERGKVGVMGDPPKLAHFNGTIYTYRTYRDRGSKQVKDELFRILLLSLLESAIELSQNKRATPEVRELQRGLHDPHAPVQYDTEVNRRGYCEFRHLVQDTIQSPAFSGKRGEVIGELLSPFDQFFKYESSRKSVPAISPGTERETALGD